MELKLSKVSKSFNSKKAVNKVSFQIGPGVHGLLGANGSGKTTLIRLIAGIAKADQGIIKADGRSIQKNYSSYTNKLGYMPQHFGYYPNYTVEEFLNYMAVLKDLSPKYTKKRINTLLTELNLKEQRKKKMKQLSGGMLRRVGIAQALLNEPEILLLDEPTAGLDPKERITFRNLIASLADKCCIILSTHIVSDIESIADDVLIMKSGNIILHDTCDALLNHMNGKVFEVRIERRELPHFEANYPIVNTHQEGNQMVLRLVSDTKPTENAVVLKPDLDDLYMYYFFDDERRNNA